jgi:hypothetical protein
MPSEDGLFPTGNAVKPEPCDNQHENNERYFQSDNLVVWVFKISLKNVNDPEECPILFEAVDDYQVIFLNQVVDYTNVEQPVRQVCQQ